MTANLPRLLPTTLVTEPRGTLLAIEAGTEVPFEIRRTFIVSGVPAGEERGVHAHHDCEQFLVCLQGSLSAIADTGHSREIFELSSPSVGLYMPSLTWGTQFNHSPDCVLLVLASARYDRADYINDYDEFLREVAARG